MKSKKELKEEYQQMKFRMGVFQIRNLVSGKIFIGSSTNLDAIWNRHRFQLNYGNHPNPPLQNDWKELGEENFRFEILSEIEPKEGEQVDYQREVKLLEELYLDELTPFDERGYHRKKG